MSARCEFCLGRGYVYTGERRTIEHRSLGLIETVSVAAACPHCSTAAPIENGADG